MNKNITLFLIICAVVIVGALYVINSGSSRTDTPRQNIQNVSVTDGVQYVAIVAQGGYSPRRSVAQSGIPTVLMVTTDNTYDCSVALAIHSLDYKTVLQPTGTESIDIGTPKPGDTITGVCSMGMYSFVVEFR